MSSDRFVRNSVFGTLAGLATALGAFLSMLVAARILGPEGAGVVAYVLWLVTLCVTFLDFGVQGTIARYLPELSARGEEQASRELAAFLLWPYLALAALGAAALASLGLGGSASEAPRWAWDIIALMFALQFLSTFGLARLRGLQRFDAAARLTVASLAIQIPAVALGALRDGANGALIGYCAGSAPAAIAAFQAAAARPRMVRELRDRALRFALFSWAGALTLALVWSRLEVFFLERYHGAESVALFTVGFTFANLAAQGPLLLTSGLLPYFSESHGRNATAQINSAYATATRVMAFLLFPVCLGLSAILPMVLPLLYGSAFAGAAPVACVLVAGAAIGATGSVGSQLIYARERSDFIFVSGLAGAALSVAAGFLIVPAYGMMGAALARAAIHGVMLALGAWFIARRLGCPMPILDLGKLLAAAALSAAAAHLCVVLVHDPAAALPLAIGLAALVYLLAVRALGALPAQDIARIGVMMGRLPDRARAPMRGLLALLAPRGA